MKLGILGTNAADVDSLLRQLGFEIVQDPRQADALVTYGGDGTLIGAEIEYPGVPKLPIRDGTSCVKCARHGDRAMLERLMRGELQETRLIKLEASVRGHKVTGLNDILIRNADLRSAVRFIVSVNGERATDEVIGDGLVISTPFGSSAYFRSITNTTFRNGIGIAFNNCTEFNNHLVLDEGDELLVEIIRGPASMTADNNPKVLDLDSGDDVRVHRSQGYARVFGLDALRCPYCRYTHAPRRRF
ncbi:MAG: NAD(+)/NADH kinase [Planctomycetes bacterium]|nr:NAD(+)/NADH kinase [Planctomycetota bacterium]